MVFPVVRYGYESWTVKKAEHRRIDAFELWCWRKVLRVPWTARRSNQSILRSALGFLLKKWFKAETPVLWPSHAKNWFIGKDFDAGRNWGQEEKGTTEDEMAGWHHCLDGRESVWTPCIGDGQGGLVCCNSWGCKESDTTEWLNWTELKEEKARKIREMNEEERFALLSIFKNFYMGFPGGSVVKNPPASAGVRG